MRRQIVLAIFAVCFSQFARLGCDFRGVMGNSQETGCNNNPADIVFLLDESSSIWIYHFYDQLEFVQSVVNDFQISPDLVQIGVMTFGDYPIIRFNLGDYERKRDIIDAIQYIQPMHGGTHTGEALRKMRQQMFSTQYAREGLPHIGIVITDGVSADRALTAREAAAAHAEGITLFALGVGDKVNEEELYTIASSAKYVYSVGTFDALESLREILAWEACQITTSTPATTTTVPITTTTQPTTTLPAFVPTCRPVDVIFSTPNEAGIRDTAITLDFITSVLPEAEEIGSEGVRVGMTARMCADKRPISLNKYDTKRSLVRGIRRRKLSDTKISEQIQQMMYEFETKKIKDNSKRARVGIMVVDNVSADPDDAINQALLARDMGLELVVIGIGPYADQEEIQKLVGPHGQYYCLDSYDELSTIQHDISGNICVPM